MYCFSSTWTTFWQVHPPRWASTCLKQVHFTSREEKKVDYPPFTSTMGHWRKKACTFCKRILKMCYHWILSTEYTVDSKSLRTERWAKQHVWHFQCINHRQEQHQAGDASSSRLTACQFSCLVQDTSVCYFAHNRAHWKPWRCTSVWTALPLEPISAVCCELTSCC